MRQGEIIERDGERFEVLREGVEYKPDNRKRCLRPPGKRRCVSLQKAESDGLVQRVQGDNGAGSTSQGGGLQPNAGKSCPVSSGQRTGQSQDLDLFSRVQFDSEKNREGSESTSSSAHESSAAYGPAATQGEANEPTVGVGATVVGDSDTFFLSVDSFRGRMFLSRGLVYPAALTPETAADYRDDLAQTPEALALRTDRDDLPDHQLRLRLLLSPAERETAEVYEGRLMFPLPLPISRVVGIELPSEAELHRVEGWIYPDVPVPWHLFSVRTDSREQVQSRLDERDGQDTGPVEPKGVLTGSPRELSEAILRYDRYLGLFAYLRNAGRFLSVRTKRFEEVPALLLRALSMIRAEQPNEPSGPAASSQPEATGGTFDEELLGALLHFREPTRPGLRLLVGLMESTEHYIDRKLAREAAGELYGDAGRDEGLGRAFGLLFKGDYLSAMEILVERKDCPEASLLATLYKFSDRGSNDHVILKQQLHQVWPDIGTLSRALATLGAYYGYAALDAREVGIEELNPLLVDVVPPRPPLKFHLETRFERELVEAVYRRALRGELPGENAAGLYEGVPAGTADREFAAGSLPDGAPVRVSSHTVGDLRYRCFDLGCATSPDDEELPSGDLLLRAVSGPSVEVQSRTEEQIVALLEKWPSEVIDDSLELGKYLLWECLPYSDVWKLTQEGGQVGISYRIGRQTVIALIRAGTIHPSAAMIACALEQDLGSEPTS